MAPIKFSQPYCFQQEADAAADTVNSGWLVGGPRLLEFENRIAVRCGARNAVGVSSWTTGAFLVLHALGIGEGDEVIVPSYTFIASVNVITHTGARPVFADIDPDTGNIAHGDVAAKVTPRTRAIIPVDQIGLPCDIDAINEIASRHGLLVLDDAACALGSSNRGRPVGSLADVTVFSLHARKVITTGEGGMILTDDDSLAERLRRLRHQAMSLSDFHRHGQPPTTYEEYPEVGYNFRMTDIQAAIGLAQLDRLDEILRLRKEIADRYSQHLQDHPLLKPPGIPEGMSPNWQSYQVSVRDHERTSRESIMLQLHDMGVPTRRGVMAAHLEAPYRGYAARLPFTERAQKTGIQLPMHPALTDDQLSYILECLDRTATMANLA